MIDQRRRRGCDQPGWRPGDLDIEILRLLSRGHTTDAIARRVGVSERTVRRRLRAIADEIGVESSIEAVVHAVRVGLI
ncbi:response regulator transcription factor [Nocardioides bizhenqiangii]|uniref:Helix-turn-helix transcriptional regulator n=1 Tax=Nocardioides bizhenqiangii TaxID=3095076 RepID=A0ABZ0ZPM7_9ACTN|nr:MULTISPECIES: helix-turn-helix transcriptional regulator [unclassified Nocardioides]MDZ5619717.1 helix-turn-helix transcriptional regulator [Nocardioides sp. HM23]WQQ26275.1 helix-turn-helix transcriptional regulator [Nocardioides sp. HM61]